MQCFFGEIIDEKMHRSDIGEIAYRCWVEIPNHFRYVELDEFEIMPNHVHGILVINDRKRVSNPHRGRNVPWNVSTKGKNNISIDLRRRMSHISPESGSLGVVIRLFKSAVSNEYRASGLSAFGWQERFYDHVIRNENDLRRIRLYIRNNVLSWEFDRNKPPTFLMREQDRLGSDRR